MSIQSTQIDGQRRERHRHKQNAKQHKPHNFRHVTRAAPTIFFCNKTANRMHGSLFDYKIKLLLVWKANAQAKTHASHPEICVHFSTQLATTPINYMFDTRRTHNIRQKRSRAKENSINPHATGERKNMLGKTLRVRYIRRVADAQHTPRKMKTKISLFNIHFVCQQHMQQHCHGYGYNLVCIFSRLLFLLFPLNIRILIIGNCYVGGFCIIFTALDLDLLKNKYIWGFFFL